jgi:ABC-2 type transport system permease protein
MKQFWGFIYKEFLHVFRDKKTLLLLFGLPIIQILLFGFALTNEIKNAKVAIIDNARDIGSKQIISKIEASQQFSITRFISPKQIELAFKTGKIKMAIVFPQDFYEDLMHEKSGKIQLIMDASDPNTATTLANVASGIIQSYTTTLQGNNQLPININLDTRMLYNPSLQGSTNFVPGVMALVLLLICVLMTSVSIVREKENGTMELLLVSPFNAVMIILAKAIPYLIISLFNLVIILLLSIYVLDMVIKGNLILLFTESTLLIITALSLGLLISNIAATQQVAMVVSLMGMLLPTMLLTGFMFPIENMPLPLQLVSNLVPSKWYYIIIKNIMIKGLGIEAVWRETLILFGMTLFLLALSIKNFKTRLA